MKKSVIFIIICLFALVLVGCKKNKEIDWDSKTIASVVIREDTINCEYDIDDDILNMILLDIQYTDGTGRSIPIDESMFIDREEFENLSKIGKGKTFVLDYKGIELEGRVDIINYANQDKRLNVNLEYNSVIKIIRNLETNQLEIFVEPLNGFAGMQTCFTFDTEVISFSNFDFRNGYGKAKVEGNKLYIDFVTNQNITEEKMIGSFDFVGSFRNSKLAIDETFNNKCFTISDSTTIELSNILYHVSKK